MADTIEVGEKQTGGTLSAAELNEIVQKTNAAIAELNQEKTNRANADDAIQQISGVAIAELNQEKTNRANADDAIQQISAVNYPKDGSTLLPRTFGGLSQNYWWLKNVKLVLVADDLTENRVLCTFDNPSMPGDAVLNGSQGQVMSKIPKIYYKEVFDENGILVETATAPVKLNGYRCHEKFVRPDGSERDYIYIGAYEASSSAGNVLQSVSGVVPLTGVDLATFRTRAFSRGSGWYPFDFYTQHLIQLLFYAVFADFNSQTKLPGFTEASSWNDAYKRNTGRSNVLTSMNGSIDAYLAGIDADLGAAGVTTGEKIANRFLFIENIFGHIWKMMDGVAFDGRVGQPNTVYATADPAKFSSLEASILANYINLNVVLPAAVNENYMQSFQSLFLPKAHGGNSSTYVTDYFWSYLDDASRNYLRLVLVGGALSYGAQAGLASRSSYYGLGHAYSLSGSRLCAAP